MAEGEGAVSLKWIIVSVGKIREDYLRRGVFDYLTRLKPYVSIELIEGLEVNIGSKATLAEIRKGVVEEGRRILDKVRREDILVALDEKGRLMDSLELAEWLQAAICQGKGRVVVVIGGPNGLADEVKKRADLVLSLSRLTFPHQMAVLIWVEQLYRCLRIMRGEPYHK